jgi:hypothetical protein
MTAHREPSSGPAPVAPSLTAPLDGDPEAATTRRAVAGAGR